MLSGRRGFLSGVGAFLAAPSIVRVAANLMPISVCPNYAAVRELFGWDALNDIMSVRYDVIIGGQQYGLDLMAARENQDTRANIDRLFAGIESMTGKPARMAEMVRPMDPIGYRPPNPLHNP